MAWRRSRVRSPSAPLPTCGCFRVRSLRIAHAGDGSPRPRRRCDEYHLERPPMRSAALFAATLSLFAFAIFVGGSAARVSAPPQNISPPRIHGSPHRGKNLVAVRGRWTGGPTRFRYAWVRCSKGGAHCSSIRGAKRARYRLGVADVGRRVRVVGTAYTGSASGSAGSQLTRAVSGRGHNPPPPPPPPAPPPAPPPPPPP